MSKPQRGFLARLLPGLFGEPEAEQVEEKPEQQPRQADARPAQRQGQKSQGSRNNRRRSSSAQGERRTRNKNGDERDSRAQNGSEQPKQRQRPADAEGGGSSQSKRRGGQRKRPAAPREEAANENLDAVAETTDEAGQDKPRRRPSDMKRSEPTRRRRSRNRKPQDGDPATPVADATGEVDADPTTPVVAITETAATAGESPVGQERPQAAAAEPTASEPPAVSEAAEEVTAAADEAPASAEAAPPQQPEALAPEPMKAEVAQRAAPDIAEPASTAGINEMGRAYNDPRVEPRPVGVVEIVTSHPMLFGDSVAPPVAPSGRVAPRAVNDPRGPLPEAQTFAEAAG